MAYRQMLKDADKQMEKVIENMPSGIFRYKSTLIEYK